MFPSSGIFDNLQIETPDGKLPLIRIAQIQQKSAQLIVINLGASPQVLIFLFTLNSL